MQFTHFFFYLHAAPVWTHLSCLEELGVRKHLPVDLSLLHNHLVGLLPHDATMKPDLSPVDDCNTETSVVFLCCFFCFLVSLPAWTSSNATPEQTLRPRRCWRWLRATVCLEDARRCLWCRGESTCAQRGWVHGAGAAQDIHSLTSFLSETEKSDWLSQHARIEMTQFSAL